MTELEKYKLEFEDLPGYGGILSRLKSLRIKKSIAKRKKRGNV